MKLKLTIASLSLACSSVAFAASAPTYKAPIDCAYAPQANAHEKDKREVAVEKYNEVFKGPNAPKKSGAVKAVI